MPLFLFAMGALGWLGLMSPCFAASRCEDSLSQKSLEETIEICREELTAPLVRQKRVLVLTALGKAYLEQQEAELAIQTWHEASQYLTPNQANLAEAEQWAFLRVLIAQTHAQFNQEELARVHFSKTAERVDRDVGRHSMAAGIVQNALGDFYAQQQHAQAAEEAFKRARIIHEVHLGRWHLKTIEVRMNHAVGLLDMNQETLAQEHFQVLVNLVSGRSEFNNEPVKAELLTYLGTLQMRQDLLMEAAKNYQAAFEVRQRVFGVSSIKTSQSLNNLGVVLYRLGDLGRAEQALSRAYIIRRDTLGEMDALTASTKKNLQAVISATHRVDSRPPN